MLIPTKHQDLSSNTLVLGADILFHLKNEKLFLEDLFQRIKPDKNIDLESFFDAITFLWLIDAINLEDNKIVKTHIAHDIREDLF